MANNSSDIERESLSAHVEICTLRYQNLDDKISAVKEDMTAVKGDVVSIRDDLKDLKDAMENKDHQSTNRLMQIGVGIIGGLLSICGALILKLLTH